MRRLIVFLAAFLIYGCNNNTDDIMPTWHRDIHPIIDAHCSGCHQSGGIGPIVFNEHNAQSLAGLIVSSIETGRMPPWMPSDKSMALIGERRLNHNEYLKLQKWTNAGSPLGNESDYKHQEYKMAFSPSRLPDMQLRMDAPYYPAPKTLGQSDDYRCFLLNGSIDKSIIGYDFEIGNPKASHHVAAILVDNDSASRAKILDGEDGAPGWSCSTDWGQGIIKIADLSPVGIGPDTGVLFGEDIGISPIPNGGRVIMQMHYLPNSIPMTGDLSGINIWLGNASHQILEFGILAPSELPCPSGFNTPNCTREAAINRVKVTTPEQERAANDQLLIDCNQRLDIYLSKLPYTDVRPDYWPIETSCEKQLPVNGKLIAIHPHAHTRTKSVHVEIQLSDGSWLTIIDIPNWRWIWESSFRLVTPIPISRTQQVRVSCVFDNGYANQWSVLAGPGRDGPAIPPLEVPSYRIGGLERQSEMCSSGLTIEVDKL